MFRIFLNIFSLRMIESTNGNSRTQKADSTRTGRYYLTITVTEKTKGNNCDEVEESECRSLAVLMRGPQHVSTKKDDGQAWHNHRM